MSRHRTDRTPGWIIALVVVASITICGAIALVALPASTTSRVTPWGGDDINVEDCDAEDYRNREDDCGFGPADRARLRSTSAKPSTKPSAAAPASPPAPAKTTAKPAPAKTPAKAPTTKGRR